MTKIKIIFQSNYNLTNNSQLILLYLFFSLELTLQNILTFYVCVKAYSYPIFTIHVTKSMSLEISFGSF